MISKVNPCLSKLAIDNIYAVGFIQQLLTKLENTGCLTVQTINAKFSNKLMISIKNN